MADQSSDDSVHPLVAAALDLLRTMDNNNDDDVLPDIQEDDLPLPCLTDDDEDDKNGNVETVGSLPNDPMQQDEPPVRL
jgi:hypothetical protein